MAAISKPHWRDRAIQQSEFITDLWQVLNAYAGRLSEVVLFGCMICNILEMLPGVVLSSTFTSTVLGIQIVSLDIGGLSLSSMAHHAREQEGSEKAADVAMLTSRFLIGLMICTLLTVSVGVLYPHLKDYTKPVENAMVLIRVVMTVVYSSVIHALRSHHATLHIAPTSAPTTRPSEDEQRTNNAPQDAPTEETPDAPIAHQQNETGAPPTRQDRARVERKNAPKRAPTSKQKVLLYQEKHPEADAVEVASKCGCGPAYVRKIIAQQQKGN